MPRSVHEVHSVYKKLRPPVAPSIPFEFGVWVDLQKGSEEVEKL